MNFRILSAIAAKVAKEGKNFGKVYFKLSVEEDSMFAEKTHTVVLFPTTGAIPKWEAAIEKNEFPMFPAKYQTISCPDIPAYKLKGENASDKIYRSITILVPIDSDGNFRIAPITAANATVSELMEVVTESNEPHVVADMPK